MDTKESIANFVRLYVAKEDADGAARVLALIVETAEVRAVIREMGLPRVAHSRALDEIEP